MFDGDYRAILTRAARRAGLALVSSIALLGTVGISVSAAQDRLQWERPVASGTEVAAPDPYRPGSVTNDRYREAPPSDDNYVRDGRDDRYRDPPEPDGRRSEPPNGYGEPYRAPRADADDRRYRRDRYRDDDLDRGTYSENEIVSAGHSFFGSVNRGLAEAIQSLFRRSGPPNGYILGEDAGGAFIAGLRYGEGRLYTKEYGDRKVFWQGPSVGYDFGGEGSKVMVLVYNLPHPDEIYRRFAGVQGAAYLVGGVSVQFQKSDDIVLAPIRSGVGLRLGANVGYLKYSRRPTWNPF